MKHLSPCIWFDDQAEDAANFYVSIIRDSRIKRVNRYGKSGAAASGKPEGSVMTVDFELDGRSILALNGGPHFTLSPAVSLVIPCDTQEEIDDLWSKLSDGGEEGQCGWLTDKFGMSWQVVPSAMAELFDDKDPAASERAMNALISMKKIDIEALRKAYNDS